MRELYGLFVKMQEEQNEQNPNQMQNQRNDTDQLGFKPGDDTLKGTNGEKVHHPQQLPSHNLNENSHQRQVSDSININNLDLKQGETNNMEVRKLF